MTDTIPAPRIWSATELLSTVFPDPKFAVPGIIPEGLTVVCSSPKFGKSWWCLANGIAVATGGMALGKIKVDEGDVLYLALEDNPRRLQDRLTSLLGDESPPARLSAVCEWTPHGFDHARDWLANHPGARLVMVDVLAKTRPPIIKGESAYSADYRAVGEWKKVADDFGVPVVLVHHTRKAGAEDYLDTVSGTQGVAGAADAVIVMTRSRGDADAVLSLTGRDVSEATYAMTFDKDSGHWTLLDGPAVLHSVSDTRKRIFELLMDGTPRTPAVIAAALPDLNPATVRKTLRRMVDTAQLRDDDGTYTPVTPVTVSQPQVSGETSSDTQPPSHNPPCDTATPVTPPRGGFVSVDRRARQTPQSPEDSLGQRGAGAGHRAAPTEREGQPPPVDLCEGGS